MSRILHLLRHAQSAERQQGQHDKDRELNTEGMKESNVIGHYLKKNYPDIEIIVSSAALRAQQTSAVIHGILNLDNPIYVEENLYEASIRNLLEFTNQIDDAYKKVLLVGHNPYISYFAEFLCKAEIGSMNTAGLATLKIGTVNYWSEVNEGCASLENYTYPARIE